MEKILLKIDEAAQTLSLSRSKAYELVASGQLPTVRVGGVLRVPVEELRDCLRPTVEKTSKNDSASGGRKTVVATSGKKGGRSNA